MSTQERTRATDTLHLAQVTLLLKEFALEHVRIAYVETFGVGRRTIRALSGRLKFTVRRHKINNDSLFAGGRFG